MFRIEADQQKNRLYVNVSGFLGEEELRRAADEFIEKVKTLRPPLDVVNDVSTFRPSTPKGAEEIKRAQAFLNQYGVRHVVRVVERLLTDDRTTFEQAAHTMGAAQFRRTAREVGYKADEALSREEAEAVLDDLAGDAQPPGAG